MSSPPARRTRGRLARDFLLHLTAPLPFYCIDDKEFDEYLESLGHPSEYSDFEVISLSPLSSLSSLSTTPSASLPPSPTLSNVTLLSAPAHQRSRPTSPSSSSSSSSSYDIVPRAYSHIHNMNKKDAPVTVNSKAAPTLGEGTITPAVLSAWENGCFMFFRERDIADDKKVMKAVSQISNEVISDWYHADYERFDNMTWDDFTAALRLRFLPKGWALGIYSDIFAAKQQTTDRFEDFVLNIERFNARLRGTEYRQTELALRGLLIANMCEDLRNLVSDPTIMQIASYVDWKTAVSNADARRLRNLEVINSLIAARTASTSRSSSTTRTFKSTTSGASASSATTQNLPKLSQSEKLLLNEHQGCYKCRRFYAGHLSGACPNGFPKAETYTPLTQASALKAREGRTAKDSNKSRTVATVDVDTETIDATVIAGVTSGQPLAATTGILGSGSDSDECVTPLLAPHTILRARILSPSFEAEPSPLLIDSGASAVLIRRDVAERLNLRIRKLPTPFNLNNAWGTGEDSSSDWVKLSIALSDNSWTSTACRAIVVNSLCAPVILGKPFLESNHIVEDHSARNLVDKRSGRDLLAPAPPPPPPPQSFRVLRDSNRDARVAQDDAKRIRHLQFLRELRDRTAVRHIDSELHSTDSSPHTVAAVRERVELLAFQERLDRENIDMKAEFADLFPDDIPHIDRLPNDVYHRFVLKDPNLVIARRQYDCPKKYREVWKSLLDQHLAAGRLRESSSPYASPAFLIPKADPTAKPRWVNDYRALNANTVPDMHPLPKISDILADCAKGKIWGKIDMTNSFFQTKVHPDDVKYTAVTTPFGLYEWLVMPQGCRNAPSTHQRRMFAALRPYIGSICHVYLDDIIIWSQSLEEHRRNVRTVLLALRKASLFCSDKKTALFLTNVDFLGHHISPKGVEADPKKIDKILNWPRPRNTTQLRSFLGLVRYVASFLPNLADFTAVLTPLTTKDAELHFPPWTDDHQTAFDGIKKLVCSRECLTVIDHDNLGDNCIFVSCDASDLRTGGMLSVGPSLESARPVAFDSMQLKDAELNYPVHEKELLAIVRALKKWRVELLGVHFTVFTDHRTLENFHRQKDLSRRQARWQEFLAQYDFEIKYIQGENNIVADALSRVELDEQLSAASIAAIPLLREATRAIRDIPDAVTVAALPLRLSISADPGWLNAIREGYKTDSWCLRLKEAVGTLGIRETDGLLFVGEHLAIPRVPEVREGLFRCAHDDLGHFGFDKTYGALRDAYYWRKMRKELETMYIPSCEHCQRNKSSTSKPPGPLHPLPIPLRPGDSVAIDFIGRLPLDGGFDYLATVTCRLGSDVRLIPTRTDVTAEEFAVQFFDHWFCENGLPLEIISDRDKLFMSRFWTALHKLSGVKVKMSTSFHPQTDGSSERTNKTVIQALRYHVNRNQKGWVRALPRVRFAIMNTINDSTGFSRFQLQLGRNPRLIPPLLDTDVSSTTELFPDEGQLAAELIRRIDTDVLEAQDNLLQAKLAQASSANRARGPDPEYKVGDLVLLATHHRRRAYMQRGDNRVAKFMVRYDGPYTILTANPDTSSYTLELPDSMNIFPTFHASLLKPFHSNDDTLFPSRAHPSPGPIITEDGVEEYEVESIVDHQRRGRGYRFLVRWKGYGPASDTWLPGAHCRDLAALDRYCTEHNLSF